MSVTDPRLLQSSAIGQSPAPAILAFDIGGTRIKAGFVQGAAVSSLTTAPTKADGEGGDVLDTVVRVGRQLMGHQDVACVGLSVKGVVDPTRGVLLDVNEALMDWIGHPLAEIIARELGRPTYMENDARMYTLGELLHGAGRGCQNMVCLTLGTGVGCGVVLDGRVLRGPRGTASILAGHVTIQIDGRHCTCGGIGCLEAYIGTGGLIRSAEEWLASGRLSILRDERLDPRAIFAAAASGDEVAHDVMQTYARHLGAGVVTMIHAYDPDIVVLGGGMAHASGQFLPTVQAYADAHAWTVPRGRVRVVPAVLGDAAALVGASELARSPDIFL
jgi:glucokinase